VLDRELKEAQNAPPARYAPDTRMRRVRWSQGETQVLELGAGPPRAGACRSRRNRLPIRASPAGTAAAAPSPCSTRAATSATSAGATPASTEPPANSAIPQMSSRRRP
jgi:hypothetical protein